jgi:hypothetical protein
MDGTGLDITPSNPTIQKLNKIEVVGSNGSVLGSYTAGQLVQFTGAGQQGLYIPLSSLGIMDSVSETEMEFNSTSGFINNELLTVAGSRTVRYESLGNPFAYLYSLSSAPYIPGQTAVGQTSGVTRTIAEAYGTRTGGDPNQPWWGQGTNYYRNIDSTQFTPGSVPVTAANKNTFNTTGWLHLRWYFNP